MQPIDLAHLARQTGGDRVLEAEVLRLFATRSLGRSRAAEGGRAATRAASSPT